MMVRPKAFRQKSKTGDVFAHSADAPPLGMRFVTGLAFVYTPSQLIFWIR